MTLIYISARLVRSCATKIRQIIMKFARYKEKSKIFRSLRRPKHTPLSIWEDCSARVRVEGQKLHGFVRKRSAVFNIRFEKLSNDKKQRYCRRIKHIAVATLPATFYPKTTGKPSKAISTSLKAYQRFIKHLNAC